MRYSVWTLVIVVTLGGLTWAYREWEAYQASKRKPNGFFPCIQRLSDGAGMDIKWPEAEPEIKFEPRRQEGEATTRISEPSIYNQVPIDVTPDNTQPTESIEERESIELALLSSQPILCGHEAIWLRRLQDKYRKPPSILKLDPTETGSREITPEEAIEIVRKDLTKSGPEFVADFKVDRVSDEYRVFVRFGTDRNDAGQLQGGFPGGHAMYQINFHGKINKIVPGL